MVVMDYVLDPNRLRDEMLQNRPFLNNLYTSDNEARTFELLNNASDEEQKLLCKVLHGVATGAIPLRHSRFEKLTKRETKILHRKFKTLKFNMLVDPERRLFWLRSIHTKYIFLLAELFEA